MGTNLGVFLTYEAGGSGSELICASWFSVLHMRRSVTLRIMDHHTTMIIQSAPVKMVMKSMRLVH